MDYALFWYLCNYQEKLMTDNERAALSALGRARKSLGALSITETMQAMDGVNAPEEILENLGIADDDRRALEERPLGVLQSLAGNPSVDEDVRAEFSEALADPEVSQLLAEGVDRFRASVVERIFRDHPDVCIHRCAKCGAVLRSPNACQCFACGHDWHRT